jgi:hypothetical protein
MKTASMFYREEGATDIFWQVSSMLDFISESLSGLGPNIGLSDEALEGLATICHHLSLICLEAAKK